jgi:hypothetical protein
MCEAFDLVWFCIGMVEGSCNIHMELFDTEDKISTSPTN